MTNLKNWLQEPVLTILKSLPVAQQAEEIYGAVKSGTVTLLQSATGSGKSLTSPLVLAAKFGGGVLVLIPSVDVARDNASRIAKLSGKGWRIGKEVGLFAGGTHQQGSEIVVATYGAFIANKSLHNREWNAILLDESHTESWQTEVSRGDVYSRLEAGKDVAVMELTATMDSEKLKNYWESANIPVKFFKIPESESVFKRVLIQDSQAEIGETVIERLVSDDFIMVVRPGMNEVIETVNIIINLLRMEKAEEFVNVHGCHGQTDSSEVKGILSRVGSKKRVVVCTPRLLTGFNHEDLDTVITDGVAKYPYSTATGSQELRVVEMSQLELTQALGRVGRFKDGQLILLSDNSFEYRREVQTPEVSRLSSLPLCLSLAYLGRDAREVKFCNEPRDISESIELLKKWGFLDEDGKITSLGRKAEKLEIRLDLAKILFNLFAFTEDKPTRVVAILMVAAIEGGGVAAIYNKGERVNPPRLNNTQSDYLDELMLYTKAIKNQRQNWVSKRNLSRVRAITYKIIDVVANKDLKEFFGDAIKKDVKLYKTVIKTDKKGVKHQNLVASEKQEAWTGIANMVQKLGQEKEMLLLRSIAVALNDRFIKS